MKQHIFIERVEIEIFDTKEDVLIGSVGYDVTFHKKNSKNHIFKNKEGIILIIPNNTGE